MNGWVYVQRDGWDRIETADSEVVATLCVMRKGRRMTEAEIEARAALLCAAPDLLEVAQRMAEVLKSCPYGAEDIRTWMEWNDSRQAALAEWEQQQ